MESNNAKTEPIYIPSGRWEEALNAYKRIINGGENSQNLNRILDKFCEDFSVILPRKEEDIAEFEEFLQEHDVIIEMLDANVPLEFWIQEYKLREIRHYSSLFVAAFSIIMLAFIIIYWIIFSP